LKKYVYEVKDWTELARGSVLWWVLVNTDEHSGYIQEKKF